MDTLIELAKEINIGQIIVIGIMLWYGYNRLDLKVKDLGERIDKLGEKVEDIDRPLCRIEGSLSSHGHCLFNQAQSEKKAE
jgi:hypothetical protein